MSIEEQIVILQEQLNSVYERLYDTIAELTKSDKKVFELLKENAQLKEKNNALY